MKNLYWLDVPSGSEEEMISDLTSKDWVVSARREFYPAGPAVVFLSFPLHSVLSHTTSQSDLLTKISGSISTRITQNSINQAIFVAKRGFSYEGKIVGRAKEILGDQSFANRWLQATVNIDITTTGDIDGPLADRIVVEIPDGFLPVWSDTETSPPPDDHVQEFHLSPGTKDRFKGFASLINLQTIVAQTIATELHGQIEFNPYGVQ